MPIPLVSPSISNTTVDHKYMSLRFNFECFMIIAPPSVSNVQIIGDAVEDSTMKGVGNYFGGREGPSKFEWLRENLDTGLVYLFLSRLYATNESKFNLL